VETELSIPQSSAIPQDLAATNNAITRQEENSVVLPLSPLVTERGDVEDLVSAVLPSKRKLVPVVVWELPPTPSSDVVTTQELAPLFKFAPFHIVTPTANFLF